MEENSLTEWPRGHLRTIFGGLITNEFGPPNVNFRAGSQSFKVHKKVLEKHSSVLKAKLSDVWQTSGDVLQLDEEYVEPEVVEELLTWIYHMTSGGDWKCSAENAYSLCIAADYLMIPELVASCCNVLLEQICPNNFHDIHALSKHLNIDFLHRKCEEWASSRDFKPSDFTPENFHGFYRLSKQLNLDSLRHNCEMAVANRPSDFFLSPQIVKCTAEELKTFIEESLKLENTSRIHKLILLSLPIWTVASFEERFQESKNLLKFVSPKAVSSDVLFRFMETELYSKLDESHRKQYYVCPYLPTGVNSTDKLYCINQTDSRESYKIHCLDLSAGEKWSDFPPDRFVSVPVLGASLQKKLYFIGYRSVDCFIKVFSTETDEWVSFEQLDGRNHKMIAAAALDDYIYIRAVTGLYADGKSFSRYCLKTKQSETLKDMNTTTRLAHRLVTLDAFVYAIGGEVKKLNIITTPELDQDPRPESDRYERYDPQSDRWEYIAQSNYVHKLPAAVAHEGQIYVLSKAGFETYSPETDQWTRLPMPDVYLRPSLVSITGRLWLLTDSAGHNLTSKVSRLIYEFDVVKQEWTRLPDLPKGDYTGFAFVIKQ